MRNLKEPAILSESINDEKELRNKEIQEIIKDLPVEVFALEKGISLPMVELVSLIFSFESTNNVGKRKLMLKSMQDILDHEKRFV